MTQISNSSLQRYWPVTNLDQVEGKINYVSSGGILNIGILPFTFVASFQNFYTAQQHGDDQFVTESLVKLFNVLFGIINSVEKLILATLPCLEGALAFGITMSMHICGAIFIAIEMALELSRLLYLLLFKNEVEADNILEKIKSKSEEGKVVLLAKKIDFIANKYLTLPNSSNQNDIQIGKLSVLSRRIRPWLTKELVFDAHNALTQLNDPNQKSQGIQNGIKIFEKIDMQINKTLIVHSIGLIAISLAATIFAVSLFCSPSVSEVLTTVGLIGTALEFARWFAPESFLDQKDYSWSWKPWIPSCCTNKC